MPVLPDYLNWDDNELTPIAFKIATWLGIVVAIGSMLSVLGNFNVMLASRARALWAMGRQRTAPPVLWMSDKWEKRPLGSIVFLFVTTFALMMLPFEVLVVFDTCFNNVALLLETIAFVRLRYVRKNTPRPFRVPCGLPGAWLIALPKVAVIGLGLATAGTLPWIAAAVANALIFLVLLVLGCTSCGSRCSWRRVGLGCCDGKTSIDESEWLMHDATVRPKAAHNRERFPSSDSELVQLHRNV